MTKRLHKTTGVALDPWEEIRLRYIAVKESKAKSARKRRGE